MAIIKGRVCGTHVTPNISDETTTAKAHLKVECGLAQVTSPRCRPRFLRHYASGEEDLIDGICGPGWSAHMFGNRRRVRTSNLLGYLPFPDDRPCHREDYPRQRNHLGGSNHVNT